MKVTQLLLPQPTNVNVFVVMNIVREVAPWIALAFQFYLFVNIESWEMKIALVLVMGFQFWQKTRRRN